MNVLKSMQAIVRPGTAAGVTKEQFFEELFAQAKQKFVIDPETIVARQNNPDLHQALISAQQYKQRKLSQRIDPGSVELDNLLHSIGIPSNLADTNIHPSISYVLEPGVYYKRQHKLPPNQSRPTIQSPGAIQEYIGFKDTPMMDWDVAGPYHAERNATIRHLGDVEDRIQNYIGQNPESTLRLYQTPGGYRAYDLTHRQTPTQFNQSFELLDVDPDYKMIAQQRPTALQMQGNIAVNDTERFNSRINPKLGRVDWVAQPIALIQGPNALTDPVSVQRVRMYHDEPIQENFLQGEEQQAAITKVKENLPTASQFLQNQIKSYLKL